MGWIKTIGFRVVFDRKRATVTYNFFLSRMPLSWPLARKGRLLLELFVYATIDIFAFPGSSALTLEYMS